MLSGGGLGKEPKKKHHFSHPSPHPFFFPSTDDTEKTKKALNDAKGKAQKAIDDTRKAAEAKAKAAADAKAKAEAEAKKKADAAKKAAEDAKRRAEKEAEKLARAAKKSSKELEKEGKGLIGSLKSIFSS